MLAEGGRRWAERRLIGANVSPAGALAGPDGEIAEPIFATAEPG